MKWSGALPVKRLSVDGVEHEVMIDTGCTRSLIHQSACKEWKHSAINMVKVSGEKLNCIGTAEVDLGIRGSPSAIINAVVVAKKPLGFAMILGMDGIEALGGVQVCSPTEVHFPQESAACAQETKGAIRSHLVIEKEDFEVRFDEDERRWVMAWKWSEGAPPYCLKNSVGQYRITEEAKDEYREEVALWIQNGWLLEYDEQKYGPVKGLIPLMAVIQPNKGKVRPVMDFREMNSHVEAFTGDADVCSEKIREWRGMGDDVALLDLKKAYLQIHVEEALWQGRSQDFRLGGPSSRGP